MANRNETIGMEKSDMTDKKNQNTRTPVAEPEVHELTVDKTASGLGSLPDVGKYEIVPGQPITMNYMGVDIVVEPKNSDGTANPAYTKLIKQLEDQMDSALADDRFMLEDTLKEGITWMLKDIQEKLDVEHGEGVKDVSLLLAGWAIGVWFGSKGIDRVHFSEGKKLEGRERAKRSDAGSTQGGK